MIRKIAVAAAAAVLLLSSAAVRAIDGMAVEIGAGEERTVMLRLSLTDRWRKPEPHRPEGWRLAGYWEYTAGLWDNPDDSTAELAVTPVFRFERGRFYVEGAIGFHLVQTHISAHRSFSTAFQFGDHLGAGYYFGPYDLCLRVQHLSNGGIAQPNPGINFVLVRLHYPLQ